MDIQVGDMVKLVKSKCTSCDTCTKASSRFWEVAEHYGDIVELEIGEFQGCTWEVMPRQLEND